MTWSYKESYWKNVKTYPLIFYFNYFLFTLFILFYLILSSSQPSWRGDFWSLGV